MHGTQSVYCGTYVHVGWMIDTHSSNVCESIRYYVRVGFVFCMPTHPVVTISLWLPVNYKIVMCSQITAKYG